MIDDGILADDQLSLSYISLYDVNLKPRTSSSSIYHQRQRHRTLARFVKYGEAESNAPPLPFVLYPLHSTLSSAGWSGPVKATYESTRTV
jgi:hypothetical protein